MAGDRPPSILAVVPARGGSRGVPRKNIRLLAGHPLLEYTIAAARASDRVTALVVSTEDADVAQVARSLGVDVVDRPPELSSDEAPTAPVIEHAVGVIEPRQGGAFEYVLTLQPTTPFRLGADIDAAAELLDTIDEPSPSVTSVVRIFDAHPARVQRIDGGRLVPYDGGPQRATRRQDLPPAYLRNGAIYLTLREVVLGGSVWGEHDVPYEMPVERSVNIDEPLDLLLAEAVLAAGLVVPDLGSSPG